MTSQQMVIIITCFENIDNRLKQLEELCQKIFAEQTKATATNSDAAQEGKANKQERTPCNGVECVYNNNTLYK